MVDLKPGGAYMFWGYRTFHGNMPCGPDHLRATLILQYGDPHRGSPVLSLLRLRRELRMRRWGRRHTVRSAPPVEVAEKAREANTPPPGTSRPSTSSA